MNLNITLIENKKLKKEMLILILSPMMSREEFTQSKKPLDFSPSNPRLLLLNLKLLKQLKKKPPLKKKKNKE